MGNTEGRDWAADIRAMLVLCVMASAAWCLSLSAVQGDGGAETSWTYVDDSEGVRTWRRDVPGQSLPGFRGETVIEANLEHILKTMFAWEKHTDWMYRCAESKLLKRIGDGEALMYNRTAAPWPVWDRDVVVKTTTTRSPDQALITFNSVDARDLRPVPERTVRMPKLEGLYKLVQMSPGKTRVTYQVESDIGGSIPKWLATRATRDLPRITLVRLRDRVASTAGR
jgi:START domain